MPIPIQVGTQVYNSIPWVNIGGGEWRKCTQVWVNIGGGNWRPCLPTGDVGSFYAFATSTTYTHTFTSNVTVTITSLYGAGGGGAQDWAGTGYYGGDTTLTCGSKFATAYGGQGGDGMTMLYGNPGDAYNNCGLTNIVGGGADGGDGDYPGGNGGNITGTFTANSGETITIMTGFGGDGDGGQYSGAGTSGGCDISWVSR